MKYDMAGAAAMIARHARHRPAQARRQRHLRRLLLRKHARRPRLQTRRRRHRHVRQDHRDHQHRRRRPPRPRRRPPLRPNPRRHPPHQRRHPHRSHRHRARPDQRRPLLQQRRNRPAIHRRPHPHRRKILAPARHRRLPRPNQIPDRRHHEHRRPATAEPSPPPCSSKSSSAKPPGSTSTSPASPGSTTPSPGNPKAPAASPSAPSPNGSAPTQNSFNLYLRICMRRSPIVLSRRLHTGNPADGLLHRPFNQQETAGIARSRLANTYYAITAALLILRIVAFACTVIASQPGFWSKASGIIGDLLGLLFGLLFGLAMRRADARTFLTERSILQALCMTLAFTFGLAGIRESVLDGPHDRAFFTQSGYSVAFLQIHRDCRDLWRTQPASPVGSPTRYSCALHRYALALYSLIFTTVDPLNDSTGANRSTHSPRLPRYLMELASAQGRFLAHKVRNSHRRRRCGSGRLASHCPSAAASQLRQVSDTAQPPLPSTPTSK